MLVFLKKHEKLIFFSILIIYLIVIYVLRGILYPFIVGLFLAYLFLPVIKWIDRKLPAPHWHWRKRRILIIGISYFVFLLFFVGFTVLLFSSLRPVLESFANDAANLYTSAYSNIFSATERFLNPLFNLLPQSVHDQVNQFIYNFGLNAIDSIVKNLSQNGPQIGASALNAILGIIIMPVFLFYILKDWESISNSLYSGVPNWAANHTKNIVGIIDKVLGRYIRAQLTLGAVVGLSSLIGLMLLQIPFAPILALIAGLMEMVPTIGPWISGIVAILVTAALVPDKIVWVILLALGIQLAENIFLVPRIQGRFMHIHPALVMVLLVVGVYLAGIWGFILILPLTATLRDVYKYVRVAVNQPIKQLATDDKNRNAETKTTTIKSDDVVE